tara:strand:- start:4500 stop:4913 length:414 start_codon:yes stop_codon:yes gene_type:complete
MPNVTLTFNHTINVSVQVGDIAYFVVTDPVGPPGTNGNWAATTTPHMTKDRESVKMIGPIIEVSSGFASGTIVCDMPTNLAIQYGPPPMGAFIMFSKDNKANLSSLLGYYSLVRLRNNSKTEAELFGIGADFIESSK